MAAKSGGQEDFPPLQGMEVDEGGNPINNGDDPTNNGGNPTNTEGNLNQENGLNGVKPKQNYAQKTDKQKSQWLVLHLHREERSISYNLTKKEKAHLLFRRLKLPADSVKSIESCNFEQLRIELSAEVNVENYKKAEAIYIRPGLKVQPMKELKRTTRVKVCWVELDKDGSNSRDQAIVDCLSMFGKVEGPPKHLMYELTETEMADNDMYKLRNVRSGERSLEIEIHMPIPSFVKIAGKRARVWYPGQNYTCGRCYKSYRSCKGKADKAECKRLKGEERDFEEFWSEICARKPHREGMSPEDTYDTDTIDIGRVPKDATKQQLLEWMMEEDVQVPEENLVTTEFAETWRILNIVNKEVMDGIVKRLNGRRFQNRNLLFLPIQLPTPVKTRYYNLEPQNGGGGDTQPSPGRQPEPSQRLNPPANGEDQTRRSVNSERQKLLEAKSKENGPAGKESEQESGGASAGGRDGSRSGLTDPSGDQMSVAEKMPEGPAAQSREEVESQVSNNPISVVSQVFNAFKNTFGVVNEKDKGPIKVVSTKKSSIPPEAEKSKTNPNDQVEETPAPVMTRSKGMFVEETPAPSQAQSASPTLAQRQNNVSTGNLTVSSNDEMWNVNFNAEKFGHKDFTSDFAKEVERRHSFSVTDRVLYSSGRPAARTRLDTFSKAEQDKKRARVSSSDNTDLESTPTIPPAKLPKNNLLASVAKDALEDTETVPPSPWVTPEGYAMTKSQIKKAKKKIAAAKKKEEEIPPTPIPTSKKNPKGKTKK